MAVTGVPASGGEIGDIDTGDREMGRGERFTENPCVNGEKKNPTFQATDYHCNLAGHLYVLGRERKRKKSLLREPDLAQTLISKCEEE